MECGLQLGGKYHLMEGMGESRREITNGVKPKKNSVMYENIEPCTLKHAGRLLDMEQIFAWHMKIVPVAYARHFTSVHVTCTANENCAISNMHG